jgi:hypothetical protein
MIKLDRNMSDLRQIVCKVYNFIISALDGFIVKIVYECTDMNNVKGFTLPFIKYTLLPTVSSYCFTFLLHQTSLLSSLKKSNKMQQCIKFY